MQQTEHQQARQESAPPQLRQRVRGENLGLRDPRSIAEGRNTLYAMFGGKVQLRPAQVAHGEKPYVIARVGLNREVLLQAAGTCLECRSGGLIWTSSTPEFTDISVRRESLTTAP